MRMCTLHFDAHAHSDATKVAAAVLMASTLGKIIVKFASGFPV